MADDQAFDCNGRLLCVGQLVEVLNLALVSGEQWTRYELSQIGQRVPILVIAGPFNNMRGKAPASHDGRYHVVTVRGRSPEDIFNVYSWQLSVQGTGLVDLVRRYKEQEAAHGP